HDAPVRERDRVAGLEDAALAAGWDTESIRGADIEAAGAIALDERVPDRRYAVVERERLDDVLAPLERLPRTELDRGQSIRQTPEERLEPREQIAKAARPVHGEIDIASPQGERLQHPRQAEKVIGVVVRE